MKNLSQKTIGIILTITAFSIFSISDVCIKITSAHYSPFAVALYMNIFTSLFLLPIVLKFAGFKKALRTKSLGLHALRSYLMLGIFLSLIYAFSQLPIASVYVIIFAMPFILNIMAIFILKEHISAHRWGSIIIALCGILIALRPDIITISLGVFAAVAAAFFNAASTITIKFISKEDHWLSYPVYMMIFQTPVLVMLVFFTDGELLPSMSNNIIYWFIGGGIAYTAALSIIPQAIQRVDASIIGALLYIVFPWGILYGYFIFGDVVDRWTLLGAAITILSGLYLIYREHIEHSKLLNMEE